MYRLEISYEKDSAFNFQKARAELESASIKIS
jgi:hypothetical protein